MTPKIIQTPEHQLSVARGRIEQLEKENDELRLKLSQLNLENKASIGSKLLRMPIRSRRCGQDNSNEAPHPQETPSFTRSTRASRLRHFQTPATHITNTSTTGIIQRSPSSASNITPGPKHVIVHGKSYVYVNGELMERSLGYLKPTKAILNRFGTKVSRDESYSMDSWGVVAHTFCDPHKCEGSKAGNEDGPQPELPFQIMTQEEFEDMIERLGIRRRTRLGDDAWLQKPTNNVLIDHDELFDILSRAERLAKRCLFKWMRINRPNRCDWMPINYVSDIDLGRQSLEWLTQPSNFFRYRHTKSHEVKGTIQCLIELRNRVHHFSGGTLRMDEVDQHLFWVQLLAVQLYDEESARSARILRDRLRHVAEQIAGEIETLNLLRALPFVGEKPWQPYHIKLFSYVTSRIVWEGYDKVRQWYAPAVMEAVEDYPCNRKPWHCKPDVEASLAKAQIPENGGHGQALTSGSDEQRGRITGQGLPVRWRSSSVNGPRRLELYGNQGHVRTPARRGTFSSSGAARGRSLL
ncbi:hypothetical protein J7T55_010979 [Diaporthe amygdali]|uniref:uncharacterized protein n=1 Tax=Phomopsis amygdali TaxID=1214568 RepID=UPI0022FE207C|nr:uncharacterized protein J7T55_010979 [Diaporthe amygdali]KAJ0103962.1 hypothetical protein J7T55_010979 [Diaporthe amygdali]